MSLNVCALTGKPISRPVVSLLTGHIFEKQEIQKHLSTFPYCPLTNQAMTLSDIIQVKNSGTGLTKPNESTSIFMKKFESQYDTLILQMHYLRQALKSIKQQILHTVYMNEAAQRVIGKLLKEKAQTEAQVLSLKSELQEKAN